MVASFRKAIEEIFPSTRRHRLLGGRCSREFREYGDAKRARGWYRRAIEVDPSNVAARESLSVIVEH